MWRVKSESTKRKEKRKSAFKFFYLVFSFLSLFLLLLVENQFSYRRQLSGHSARLNSDNVLIVEQLRHSTILVPFAFDRISFIGILVCVSPLSLSLCLLSRPFRFHLLRTHTETCDIRHEVGGTCELKVAKYLLLLLYISQRFQCVFSSFFGEQTKTNEIFKVDGFDPV